ncbi:MAG: MTH938/NDUFAF3 family protein [Xanthomonadales bacterium]|nr:MTH938/NDUFAF3 family protein [Xanthomonadales bacterium]
MQLTEHHAGDVNVIRSYAPGAARVGDEVLNGSLLLSASRLVHPWDYKAVSQLDHSAAEAVLRWEPELVLIGSGGRLEFPPGEFIGALVNAGVGYETMVSDAACRTYNVLVTEDRAVTLVLIQP